ncbi:MAG: FtsQ-type POTRA domain-containing protein [Gemmatimonadota bacterium]
MRRRVLAAGAVVAGLAAVGVLLPLGMRRLGWFRVRRIEVHGAHVVTARDVARVIGLPKGADLFDRIDGLPAKVLTLPGVLEAEVHRRIPGTLVVEIRESELVALAPKDGRLVLVDHRGRVLPYDPTRQPEDLPLGAADPDVAALLLLIKESEPALWRRVLSAGRSKNTIVVEVEGRRILFRVGATPEAIRSLATVLNELERDQGKVQEVDARFDGRIIVRRKPT